MALTTEERMKKAIIKLQGRQPFFSFLALHLNFYEAKMGIDLPKYAGMGVSPNGDVHYNKEFVDKIDDDELVSVIVHEICHLFLLHLLRKGNREWMSWGIAIDLAVNSILLKNGFKLPHGLIPDNKDEFRIMGKNGKIVTIEKISEKIAEQIFDEIPELPIDKNNFVFGQGNGDEGFDEHKEGNGGKSEKEKQERLWQKRLLESYMNSQQRGLSPLGLERYIDEIKKSQVNWRTLLQRYIQQSIVSDNSWKTRSKKSYACGVYLPSVVKETINVFIGIDTSGSIGKKELTDFLSEIIGIAQTYRERINMRLLTCDTEIYEDLEVRNGSVHQIMKITCRGGGGTELMKFHSYIKEKHYNPQLFITLTDGYCEKIEKQKYQQIFVITKGGTDENVKEAGIVINLKE